MWNLALLTSDEIDGLATAHGILGSNPVIKKQHRAVAVSACGNHGWTAYGQLESLDAETWRSDITGIIKPLTRISVFHSTLTVHQQTVN